MIVMDIREDGSELLTGTMTPLDRREVIRAHSRFIDLVQDERSVFQSDLVLDGVRR